MLGVGTHIAVLLGCSKSSRQCTLPSLLTYLLQVQQQRAASSALEGDVRSLEAYCAQLESRCESYEAERRASRG